MSCHSQRARGLRLFRCLPLLLLVVACRVGDDQPEPPRFVRAQLLAAESPLTAGEIVRLQPAQLRAIFVGCYEVTWTGDLEVPPWAGGDSNSHLLRLEGTSVPEGGRSPVLVRPATRVAPTWRVVDAYSAEVTWGLPFETFELRITLLPDGFAAATRHATDAVHDVPFEPVRVELVACP